MKSLHEPCFQCNDKGDYCISRRTRKDGSTKETWICRECNNIRKRRYYHSSPEMKDKAMFYNLKSLAKKFGFKLVKE